MSQCWRSIGIVGVVVGRVYAAGMVLVVSEVGGNCPRRVCSSARVRCTAMHSVRMVSTRLHMASKL